MRFIELRRHLLGIALCLVGACADEKPEPEVTRLVTTPDAGVVHLAPAPVAAKLAPVPAPVPEKPTEKAVAVPAPVPAPAPKPEVADRNAWFADHLEQAREALEANDPRAAREHAEQAVALVPTSSSAWNTLGRVELMDGLLDDAATAFANAAANNPKNLYAWNNLGLVEMRLEHWDDAIAALEKATATPADHIAQAYMWNNLATAYQHQGRLVEARAAYKKAAARGSTMAKESLARIDDDHRSAKADLDLKSWDDAGPMEGVH